MFPHLLKAIVVVGFLLTVAPLARAQGAFTGLVHDSSGAVLPGVTVEVSSFAIIEGAKTATTDGQGQYRIIDLRPGSYTVTFALAGFATLRRENVLLTGGATLTISAEMSLSSLSETVTVTGASPIVDVQNVRQAAVLDREMLDSIPRGRAVQATGALLPGVTASGAGGNDVGGSSGLASTTLLAVHGSSVDDSSQSIDGMRIAEGLRGQHRQLNVADVVIQEYVYQTSAISAEYASGGVRMDMIPREGGNRFAGTFVAATSTKGMVADNITDDLRAKGLSVAASIKQVWDVSPAFGGPIMKNKLWLFTAYRNTGRDALVANAFFETDPSKQAVDVARYTSYNIRLTSQLTPRNKLTFYYDTQTRDQPYFGVSATRTSEASSHLSYPVLDVAQVRWTTPVTSRLLFEAGLMHYRQHSNFSYTEEAIPNAFPMFEITTGRFTRRSTGATANTCANVGCGVKADSWTAMGKMSYLRGSHAMKVGSSLIKGCYCKEYTDLPPIIQTSNGVPFQVQRVATPRTDNAHLNYDFGLYAQDQWTIRRVTLNLGLRFDAFNEYLDEQNSPAGRYVPARQVPKIENVPNWRDISPRFGVAWDVFGTGKTAVKASASRYLYQDFSQFATDVNPTNSNLNISDTRTVISTNGSSNPDDWTLGPSTNLNFGASRLSVRPDKAISEGWGVRGNDWEYSASVQQEIGPNISGMVAYYHRQFGNLLWTNNILVTPADFTQIALRNPIDGTPLTIYNLNPAKRGVSDNVVQLAPDDYRKFDGIDLTMSGRFKGGARLTAGISMGRTATSTCSAWDPNTQSFCEVSPGFMAENQYKVLGSYPLPFDLQVSGTFVSLAGPTINANYTVTSAIAGTTLTNGTVPLRIAPGTDYADRRYRTDVRLARNFRFRGRKVQPYLDIFNLFNAAPILTLNSTYGPMWQTPTSTLVGRTFQIGGQVDF